MKYYTVKMPNGDLYGVPANIIAENYARYYAGRGEDFQDNYDTMMRWFDTNDYEFADWAKNNMGWDDVKDHAILLATETQEPDFQDGWVNGDYGYRLVEEST